MSWLASIADSLRIHDDYDEAESQSQSEDDDRDQEHDRSNQQSTKDEILESLSNGEQLEEQNEGFDDDEDPSRGVKEDLTELKQTLTRQIWGVASFLAPPPPPPSPPPRPRPETNDLVSGSEIEEPDCEASVSGEGEAATPLTLNLNSTQEEVEEEENEEGEIWDVVGITEEVLTFSRNIASHPETWLDYPIEEEDDPDEFQMTVDQREHTYAVEYLAPRLAALRIELCPAHMSVGYFWKVYFVLLHSRLEKQDAEILSTPQVMAARALWMKELQKQTQERAWLARNTSSFKEDSHSAPHNHVAVSYYDSHPGSFSYRKYEHTDSDYEVEKHPIPSTETHIVDKTIVIDKPMIESDKKEQPGPSFKQFIQEEEEDDDDEWLKDENINTSIPIWEEEEVSFSDFEEDEDLVPLKPKSVNP